MATFTRCLDFDSRKYGMLVGGDKCYSKTSQAMIEVDIDSHHNIQEPKLKLHCLENSLAL